jgi:hypothetical protein
MGENLGEQGAITTLRRGRATQRFKFFRTVVDVPEVIQADDLTREYRARVRRREVAIAFAIDEQGNLAPTLAGAMYGGIYSFLPLGEASSGVKFPIQADFLVQPGRDAINYEARWNRWLLTEIARLARLAIDEFKASPRWRYQFLPVVCRLRRFEEAFARLFGPVLFQPIKRYLESEPVIPTADGGFATPSRVFRLMEKDVAREELLQFVPASEIEMALMGHWYGRVGELSAQTLMFGSSLALANKRRTSQSWCHGIIARFEEIVWARRPGRWRKPRQNSAN